MLWQEMRATPHAAEKLAEVSGESVDAWHDRSNPGRTTLGAYDLEDVYRALGLKAWSRLSGAEALGIVCHEPVSADRRSESVAAHMLRVEAEVGQAAGEVVRAIKDNVVDAVEARAILAKLPDAKRALAELEAALNEIARVRHLGKAE